MTTDPALEIAGLSVYFPQTAPARPALANLSLTLQPGESVAVAGESGSGKSTLALAIAGLLSASSTASLQGSLKVCGTEIAGASAPTLRRVRRERIGIVFQDPMTSLNPTMRIGDQIMEALPPGTRSRQAAASWLEKTGIRDPATRITAFPHQLSGGERQRVMIAIAMASHPPLLIADEPTTALDVTVQAQILRLIRDLRRDQGTALLFVTHDLGVAAAIAERIVVLYAGRIVEMGPTADILRRPAHPYTATLIAARFGLDADRSRPLPAPVMTGAPAAAASEGCAFLPRCALAQPTCSLQPDLTPFGQTGQQAACWRAGEIRTGPAARPIQAAAAPISAGPMGAVLELRQIGKTYPGRRPAPWRGRPQIVTLQPFDLRLNERESVAIVGESGSGKSTILRIAAGLLAPDSGQVFYAGAGRPQMVFQDAAASLTPWLTIGEMVEERLRPAVSDHRRRTERAAATLARVGLDPALMARRPAELSGGQNQRAAIARAIVLPPKVLLCDEPITAVDASLAAGLLNLLVELRHEFAMATLFVTHDLAAARYIAGRIIVLRKGEVVEDGPSDQVVTRPHAPYTRQLIEALPENLAGRHGSH